MVLVGDGNRDDFHDSPNNVENSWYNHADEEQQKRVVQDALHDGNARCFLILRLVLMIRTHDLAPVN